jgi:phosphoglycerol transferase MdoB-like AlkP superfamily enzyme
VVLLSARAVTLGGRDLPLSFWSAFAFVWQDVLAALLFYIVDGRLRRSRLAWCVYAAAVAYVALNVPVTRVLSTPLTWTMLRAARGPLADAIVHYATPANLGALAVPLVVGIAAPPAFARFMRARSSAGTLATSVVLAGALAAILIGPYAASRVDTRGLERNAFGALVASALPRVRAAAGSAENWRASPFDNRVIQDLSPLRGTMRGRNVVLVILESTGARHLGLYGSSPDPMPRLSGLASNALVFERAYSVYPESIKGLFATLCSRYPAFDTPPELYADVPCGSIAATLKEAGYRTALFHSGRFMYLGMNSVIERRGFDVLEDAGPIGGQIESSFGVEDAATVLRALQWIDQGHDGAPFFMTYLPTSGHSPYATTAPGPFESSTDFWRYMNALHESDAALGALIDGLRARQLDTKTLFVVFGDHGEAFGEHPGNFAHTMFINEENVRVPYVIAAPGAIPQQTRINRIASIVDTAPTILNLLGLPPNPAHQGMTLLAPAAQMALFYTDYSIGWLGLADGCWKYLYEIDTRRSRLFDVCTDPGETQDRAAAEPSRTAAYRDRVTSWAAAQKDLVRNRL